jgi:predicted Zn-dependent protease
VGLTWTLFGVALAALLYFGWRDGSAWVADTVPRKWEKNLGDRVRGAMLDGLYACDGKDGKAALESLGRKLLPENIADLPLTIDVVRVKQVNAFALPGNHIFIFSGLIDKARNPDEVAGVLAHEMGHLELRHPTRGMIQQLGLSAVISLMFGGNAAGDVAFLATSLSYTRDMEREADAEALALLKHAKIHTDGLASFFRALKDDKDSDSPLPDWLSTHPGLQERAEAAEKAVNANDGTPALTDEEWRAVQTICAAP